jgi:hypothetical protein
MEGHVISLIWLGGVPREALLHVPPSNVATPSSPGNKDKTRTKEKEKKRNNRE